MNIRKFKASDAEKCSEVILKSMNGIKDLEDVERKYVSEHATPQYLLGEIKKRKYFVCEDNAGIVGIGCLDKDIIRTMYLLPAFQNKGAGSLIIERIEKEAKKDKIAKLSLFARPRVFNFYKKHGFKIIKQMPLGLYVMEKEL